MNAPPSAGAARFLQSIGRPAHVLLGDRTHALPAQRTNASALPIAAACH
jgi:hypothetical protein